MCVRLRHRDLLTPIPAWTARIACMSRLLAAIELSTANPTGSKNRRASKANEVLCAHSIAAQLELSHKSLSSSQLNSEQASEQSDKSLVPVRRDVLCKGIRCLCARIGLSVFCFIINENLVKCKHKQRLYYLRECCSWIKVCVATRTSNFCHHAQKLLTEVER